MGGIVALLVIGFIVFTVVKSAGGATSFDRLRKSGTPARGILLRVAPQGTRTARVPVSIENRRVRVDVEIPGQAPYEVDAVASFPANLRGDVLPGATVELRVDPKNRNALAIVGPGATFAAALLLGPQTASTETPADRRGAS